MGTRALRLFHEKRRRPRTAPGFRSRRGKPLIEGLTRAELVAKYGHKVRFIVSRMAAQLPGSVETEDLVSVGFIGLMDAADKFNASRGVKFATYAEFRIRGAILDELRRQDWVPHCARGRARSIESVCDRIERETGRRPTEAEVGDRLGLPAERVRRIRQTTASLSLARFESPEQEANQLRDEREGSDPLERVFRNDVRARLESLFAALPEEERLVLSCYYFRGLNLREISSIMGLSESRISQLHGKAIRRLRELARERSSSSVLRMLLDAA